MIEAFSINQLVINNYWETLYVQLWIWAKKYKWYFNNIKVQLLLAGISILHISCNFHSGILTSNMFLKWTGHVTYYFTFNDM